MSETKSVHHSKLRLMTKSWVHNCLVERQNAAGGKGKGVKLAISVHMYNARKKGAEEAEVGREAL